MLTLFRKLYPFLILTLLANALNVHIPSLPMHLGKTIAPSQHQQTYNATQYYNQLNNRQQRFKQDIYNLQQQIVAISKKVDTSSQNLSPLQVIRILQQALADERDGLYNIQTYLDMPFQVQKCSGQQNITQEQKQSIQQQINAVNQSLLNMQQQLKNCGGDECPQRGLLEQQIRKNKNYLRIIQATLNSKCLQQGFSFNEQSAGGIVNLADSLYKDNLKVGNWIYGDLTEQEYKHIIFNATVQYNRTSCPLDKPYVDPSGQFCISCYGTFVLSSRICQQCPNNQYFNIQHSKCLDVGQCKNGFTFDKAQGQCVQIVCKVGFRWSMQESRCVEICKEQANQYYDVSSGRCQWLSRSCPSDTQITKYRFNNETGLCQQQQIEPISNSTKPVCSPTQIYNPATATCQTYLGGNTIGVCPTSQPYWNSSALLCQKCPPSMPNYSRQFNRCERCPEGYNYNQAQRACIIVCEQSQQYQMTSNGLTCVQKCNRLQGLVYNPGTQHCTSICQNDETWDKQVQQCMKKCIRQGQVYDAESGQCGPMCDQLQAMYYNYQRKRCQPKCQDKHMIYNQRNNLCVPCPTNYRYNPPTRACVINIQPIPIHPINNQSQPINQTHQIPAPISINPTPVNPIPNPTVSPTPTPIMPTPPQIICPADSTYNATTHQCTRMSCPSSQYIYNRMTNQCLKCPPSYQYNHTTSKCQPITCPQPNQFYNATLKACQGCPTNYFYSTLYNKCLSCPNDMIYSEQTNKCHNRGCPQGYHYNQQLNICHKCPQKYQYDVGTQKCLLMQNYVTKPQCLQRYYYNENTKKCILMPSCPQGQYFSTQNQICQFYLICPAGYYFSKLSYECLVRPQCPSPNQYYSTATQKCENIPKCDGNAQYFDIIQNRCLSTPVCPSNYYFSAYKQTCISMPLCPHSYYFDVQSELCHLIPQCPHGYHFDSQLNKMCVRNQQCSSTTLYYSDTQNRCINKPQCQATQYFDSQSQQCVYKRVCSKGFYFSLNKKECAQIPQCNPVQSIFNDRYFNIQTQQCQAIPQCAKINQYFSTSVNQCMPIPACQPQQFFNKQTQKCESTSSCSVQANKYYSQAYGKCIPIPDCQSDQHFDVINQQCYKVEYMTSPDSPNLVIGTDFQAYREQYNSKVGRSQAQACPEDAPYYNFNIKECVACSREYPYFNLRVGMCQNCEYDPQNRLCNYGGTNIRVDPTLQRLIMNIV